jgi:EAL domain-containing protein (putative c-di-GMP-specific phosphodiesterase class I)/AmiR/NasT family two-component response regulator
MSLNEAPSESILILDDTVEIAELIGELARQVGFAATITTDINYFNLAIERGAPNVIALDLQMPGTDGIEVLRQLSSRGCLAGILLITGMDQRTIAGAERYGRQLGLNMLGAMQKPFRPEALIAKLRSARSLTGQLSAEDLTAAMHDGALVLRYQPVVRRLAPRVWHAESVEALPRWNHPDFGVLAPAQFLPLVGSSRSSLMRQLTDYVLRLGAEQLQQWQNSGLHLGLRVNVSAGLIDDTDFPDRLGQLLQEFSADPTLLTLEICDATALGQSRDGIEILTRLRLKGVNLSLDDFGTSDSMLRSLYTLPINEVKVDRFMTADLTREKGSSVLFNGILEMLERLDIACCAEGVESSEQMQLLDDMQCDLAQGFHICTPLPAVEIPKALTNWTANTSNRASAKLRY